MSNPSIFMGKLPIKGIFPIILKRNDFKWYGQNSDEKVYVGFTYNLLLIVYSVYLSQYHKSVFVIQDIVQKMCCPPLCLKRKGGVHFNATKRQYIMFLPF